MAQRSRTTAALSQVGNGSKEEARQQSRHEQREPITTTVEGACHLTGLGRSTIYDLLAKGKLKSLTIGRRRLIYTDSIRNLLEAAA